MTISVFLLLALCASQVDPATTTEKTVDQLPIPPIGDRIEGFIEADEPGTWPALEASDELFRSASVAELEELYVHASDRVAVGSAWELTCRRVNAKNDDSREDAALHLGAFMGFVEGRLRVQVPQQWKDALLAVEFVESDDGPYAMFLNIDRTTVYDLVSDDLDVYATKGSKITRLSETEIEITHPSGARHVVDPANFDPSDSRFNAVSLALVGTTTIAAESDAHILSRYGLIIYSDANKVPRRVKERGGMVGGASGLHSHWIILVPSQQHVFVFGVSTTAAYIHKVSLTDGSLDFAFMTAF